MIYSLGELTLSSGTSIVHSKISNIFSKYKKDFPNLSGGLGLHLALRWSAPAQEPKLKSHICFYNTVNPDTLVLDKNRFYSKLLPGF